MFDNDSSNGNATTTSQPDIPIETSVVSLVIGILSVVFNGLLLVVMSLNSKLIFSSLGSYFIANLAVADFITGLNSIGWGVEGFLPLDQDGKTALTIIFWITVQVSFYTILVMSTERLIAIVYPFRAALLMSKKKTIVYCCLVWLIAILSAAPAIDTRRTDTVWFVLTVVFEITVLIIVIEYVFVFRKLRALWLKSKTRIVHRQDSQAEICTSAQQTSEVRREYQVTIVVVTLAFILVITVFPYMIATQVWLSCMLFRPACKIDKSLDLFMWYYFPIELLNFALNPVVYAWRLPKYRNAFLRTFGLATCKDGTASPKTMQSMISPNDKQIELTQC